MDEKKEEALDEKLNLDLPEEVPGTPAQTTPEEETPVIPSDEPEPESTTSFTPSRKRNPKKLLYLVAGVLILLVLVNAVRFIGSKAKKAQPSPTPSISLSTPTPSPSSTETPTPTPSSTPTPTPKPSVNPIDATTGLDRSKLSVSVQNGSGEAGVAQKAADFLKNLGYNVISTANADNFNYKNVTIKVKPSQKDYLPLLNKDLSSNYSVGATSSDLTATASADALVIVGK